MNLSKLILNPYSREARRDLASSYDLHRTLVTKGFPDGKDDSNRMLFRIELPTPERREPGVVVLVQCSGSEPDWTHLPEDYCARIDGPKDSTLRRDDGTPIFEVGQHLTLRLLANPIRRHQKKEEGESQSRSGHPRYHRSAILDEDKQRVWLQRQGTLHGFRPLYLHTVTSGVPRVKPDKVTHEKKRTIPHVSVRFDGLIEVTDPERLLSAVENGIGPAKAFGFGLLSLARPL